MVIDKIQQELEAHAEGIESRGFVTQTGEPMIELIEQEFAEWLIDKFITENEV